MRLSPRKSFDLWQETVKYQSLPWKNWEIEAVLELRGAIVSTVLRQADELTKINLELEQSNTELDAFAYIASHDLKEPLRGIHNYSNFLIEDYSNILNEDGVNGYIVKPIDTSKLIWTIKLFMSYWFEVTTLPHQVNEDFYEPNC